MNMWQKWTKYLHRHVPLNPNRQNDDWIKLIDLLNFNHDLDDESRQVLLQDHDDIQHNRAAFAQKLLDKGILLEEDLDHLDEYHADELYCHALRLALPCYHDDWRFDAEQLSEFISLQIHQPFQIDFAECGNDMGVVCRKLEACSAFTLLDIASGGDDYGIIVVPKTHQQPILEYAEQLGICILSFNE
ncbi:DUF6630 family protein [Wielerella bovis]|uniref:DUF6630 family protein n=1 Tax=Wielerella bovis TaxID=2917790 RepID=UPI002019CA93|nr:hypothetical protein [Wielerella bovis]MCG7657609.1 hypothetical protein [Wielerella bovis]MCG7659830.1 hypothetical protein [Wielerella bovis]ULJ59824.1 hypothetical protein MIS44_09095 [Wielerella bovis]